MDVGILLKASWSIFVFHIIGLYFSRSIYQVSLFQRQALESRGSLWWAKITNYRITSITTNLTVGSWIMFNLKWPEVYECNSILGRKQSVLMWATSPPPQFWGLPCLHSYEIRTKVWHVNSSVGGQEEYLIGYFAWISFL